MSSRSAVSSWPLPVTRASRRVSTPMMPSTLLQRRAAALVDVDVLSMSLRRPIDSQSSRVTALALARSIMSFLRMSEAMRSSCLQPSRALVGRPSSASTRSIACQSDQPFASACCESFSTLVSPMPRGG